MIYAAGFAAVLVFATALELFGVPKVLVETLETSRKAAISIWDQSLSDDEKERAMKRASLSLIGCFVSIGIRGVGALGISLLTLLGIELTGLASIASVMGWLAGWEAIILMSALAAIWFLIRHRS